MCMGGESGGGGSGGGGGDIFSLIQQFGGMFGGDKAKDDELQHPPRRADLSGEHSAYLAAVLNNRSVQGQGQNQFTGGHYDQIRPGYSALSDAQFPDGVPQLQSGMGLLDIQPVDVKDSIREFSDNYRAGDWWTRNKGNVAALGENLGQIADTMSDPRNEIEYLRSPGNGQNHGRFMQMINQRVAQSRAQRGGGGLYGQMGRRGDLRSPSMLRMLSRQ